MPRLRAAVLPAVLVLHVGCATSGTFVCPARGGPPWHEAASEHFLVRTDAGSAKAVETARELESLRAALLVAMYGSDVSTRGRVEVVVFRSLGELLPFSRDVRMGGLMVEDGLGERRILVADDGDAFARRLVAHELTHLLSHYRIHRQPHWFAEGLAMFLEGAGEARLVGGRTAGSPPEDDHEFIEIAVKPPARDVLEWQQGRWPLEQLYAKSFLLFHYLYNEQRNRLRGFQDRLAAMENPRSAWNAAFPEWSLDQGDPGKLDAAVARYAGKYVRRIPLEVPPVGSEPAVRPLSGAEVHAMRLGLPHRWIPEVVRAEVDEALAEDPGNARALEERMEEKPALALGLARQATAAHPEDPLAWELLGEALMGDAAAKEREAAYRRAADASPYRVRSLVLLASELGSQGRAAEALAVSGRALEIAPWSPAVLLVHGQALAESGRCDEAVVIAARATYVASHSPANQEAAGRGVAVVQKICRGPLGSSGGRLR